MHQLELSCFTRPNQVSLAMSNGPLQLNQKRFPHWLSAWWCLIYLLIGWGPPYLADLLNRVAPWFNSDYKLGAFNMAWGLTIGLLCTTLAAISFAIQIVRLSRRFFVKEPAGKTDSG
jgi:hypothetical protein